MTEIDRNLLFDPGDIGIIRMLCSPIQSYALDEYSPDYPSYAYLNLKRGDSIQVSTTEADLGEKFDCFTLKFSIAAPPIRSHRVRGLSRRNEVFVLMREEWLEPFSGDETNLIGTNPVTQIFGRPGSAPQKASVKALVATGILVSGADQSKLAITADTFPGTLRVAVDERDVRDVSEIHDTLPLNSYLARFSQTR